MITRHARFASRLVTARTRLADLMARTIEGSLDRCGEPPRLSPKTLPNVASKNQGMNANHERHDH
ncbi:hypothetical protein ACOSOMT5_P3019 [Acidiphilium sp. MT5]